jgi:hypothetical protein
MISIFGWASVVQQKESTWKFTDKNFVLTFLSVSFFVRGEGPCSRSYGRNPCNEDEEKDDQFFFHFPSNGAPVG